MNAIEAYIEFTPGLITDDRVLTVDSISKLLGSFMLGFQGFITRVYTVLPRGGG
jgi:chromate reductase